MKKSAITPPVRDDTFWMCCTIMQITDMLPRNVDEARDILRITSEMMKFRHGDRWNYTAEEYAQHLKGKNPHGLKAPAARKSAKRGRRK